MDTLTLPPYALEKIKAHRAEIAAIQARLQSFVDGVVCGLGADMSAEISVDMDSGIVTITGGDNTPPEVEQKR